MTTSHFRCSILSVVTMLASASSFSTAFTQSQTLRGWSFPQVSGVIDVVNSSSRRGLSVRSARSGLVSMALPHRSAAVVWFAAGMVFGCCVSPRLGSGIRLYRPGRAELSGRSPPLPLGLRCFQFPVIIAPRPPLGRRLGRASTASGAVCSRAASMLTTACRQRWRLCWESAWWSTKKRRHRTVPDIPRAMFEEHASIKGVVVSVSDGDSIRVRHKPGIPLPLPGRKMTGKKSEETLQIRLYAVDCPEVAHFGNPAQPWSAEAKEFTRNALEGQAVSIKLLRKDQYQRAVCMVRYGRWPFRKDVSAELLRQGLGTLYRQGGAEYDGRKDQLSALEVRAKESKMGLWKDPGGETPAQYKARLKREQPSKV